MKEFVIKSGVICARPSILQGGPGRVARLCRASSGCVKVVG